jgi:glyoxylase-like metal-dependent hydrolase (beta-lactamase superfamily II)
MTLEDDFTDILSKAQRGWDLEDAELARHAEIDESTWRSLKSGRLDETALAKAATVLRLNFPALQAIAHREYLPAAIPEIDGLRAFTSSFHGMLVNSYLVWDPATREAAFFDTGADGRPMLEAVHNLGLSVKLIFLTHTHSDHIHDLSRLREKTGAQVFVSNREPLENAEAFHAGTRFRIGGLDVKTLSTFGHSRGGTTYFIEGLALPLAIVGDAMFAGSMGGGAFSYVDALATNREGILTLPDETIVCPGHGPLTTIGEQKTANPFFAE